jgi:hypothetical protein
MAVFDLLHFLDEHQPLYLKDHYYRGMNGQTNGRTDMRVLVVLIASFDKVDHF